MSEDTGAGMVAEGQHPLFGDRMPDGSPGRTPPVRLSDAQLGELAREYTPRAVPDCRVCGAPLRVVDSLGPKYACASQDARFISAGTAAEHEARMEHYQASRWDQARPGDPRVVALVDEVRDRRTGA